MRAYIVRRLFLFIPAGLGVTLIIFLGMRVLPGDPAVAILSGWGGEGRYAPQELETLREELGLNRPLVVQFGDWLWSIGRLDFGDSLWTGQPVKQELWLRVPVTLEFALLAIILTALIALPIGVLSALFQDSWLDYVIRSWAIVGLAMPTFWVGVLLILALALWFNWIPPMGYVPPWEDPLKNLNQIIWPALALGYHQSGLMARMTRSQMLEVLREDYIRTAQAKGLRRYVIIYRHALKNASLPVLTLFGIQFGHLLGGTVVVEQIFSLPGVGRLFIQSIFNRDYPVVQTVVLFMAVVCLVTNLLVDLLYAWLDPRIRYT